jgi:hypothetical protein
MRRFISVLSCASKDAGIRGPHQSDPSCALGNALERLDVATMTMLFTLPHSALAAGQMIVDAVSARAPNGATRAIC